MLRNILTGLVLLFLVNTAAYAQASVTLVETDRMREDGQFAEALAALEGMKKEDPQNAEVLWRLSRTRVDMGEQSKAKSEQEKAYAAAMEDAQAAVEADPGNAEAHLALAIAAGRVGLISPTKEKIQLSRTVKDAVDKSIMLDPQLGPAYHVRARWNYEVASLGFFERTIVKVVYGGLPEASFEQAVRDFQKATQLGDRMINHLELGKTYLKLDEPDKAKAEFEQVLAMPLVDPDDPGFQTEAREHLKKLR